MKVKKLKINKLKCDYLLKRIVSSDPILNKEDIYMIPYGQKIYKILEKLGIYREAKHAK